METKSLAFGIVGFLLGGLVVSVAATQPNARPMETTHTNMTMSEMTETLKNKEGDAYDAAFITSMIAHHDGAIEMAELSAERAKHDEIKRLSRDIIDAQETEISQMKRWQADWGYADSANHPAH